MDVFEQVRDIRPEDGGAEEILAAARGRLMSEVASQGRPARSRSVRPIWFVAGGLAGAAAVVVAVLVVAGLDAPAPSVEAVPTRAPGETLTPSAPPSPAPTAEPETVASVLASAANITGEHPGPVAGPDQYLRVEHQNRQLVLWSAQDPVNSTRSQATAGWVATSSYTSYIPGDRTREWVDVFAPELQIVELYGDGAGALSQEWLSQFSWITEGEPRIVRYQGGDQPGEPVAYEGYRHYDEMPREPAALLQWVKTYQSNVESGMEDMAAVTFLMQELQLGAAPGDLRAAMYRALSLIPNGIISGEDGDLVTLSFLTYPPNERWDSITIDTRTAFVTSMSMTLGSGGTAVPDAVPNNTSTLTISVVDSAP